MIAKDDDLTAEELEYLNSGGKTDVPAPEAPVESQEQPAAPSDTVSAQPKTETPSPDAEDDDDALPNGIRIITDDQGRQRLVNAEGKYVRSVPHAALHKERERRKAVEAEYAKARESQARLDERLAILNEALKPKEEPKAPPNPLEEPDIDPNEDPLGALAQAQKRVNFMRDQQARSMEESRAHSEARQTFARVQADYRADAARLMAVDPAFKDAYAFLVNMRHAEYEALGVTDVNERNAAIARDEADIVINAIKAGRPPAEAVYAIAKARGFKPVAPAAPAAGGMRPTASATQATAKLQQIREGQAASQTLSHAGGSPDVTLTAESLVAMSEDEFSVLFDKLSKEQQRELLGR
jgi:hypothetical protein